MSEKLLNELEAGFGSIQAKHLMLASEYQSLIHNTNNLILLFGYDKYVVMTIRKMANYLATVADNLEHKNKER